MRNGIFDREKRETVNPCGLGALWVGQGLPVMAGPGRQDLLHCPSQEKGSQECARGSQSPGHWPSPWG